jgi:hypothetical protein
MMDVRKPCILKHGDALYPFIPRSFTIDYDPMYGNPVTIEGVLGDVTTLRSDDLESGIEKVIFNDPATIVIWKDKTKTVVKCQPGDTYDKEKGLALCIAKKQLGNKGSFNKIFKKHLKT